MIAKLLDSRPIIVALAGPNGAGKSTFYAAHLRETGLRFLNADEIQRHLKLDPYKAADVANALRVELARRGESFIFETVFSDPVGEKVAFLEDATRRGYAVVLIFIGVSGPKTSNQRVAMRVTQGGHDVPRRKLNERYKRTLANLRRALKRLPHVLVFDNEDLRQPYRRVAELENGKAVFVASRPPPWLKTALR